MIDVMLDTWLHFDGVGYAEGPGHVKMKRAGAPRDLRRCLKSGVG